MVTLSRYIAIYIAQASTCSYIDSQYEPRLALYALYVRRKNGLDVGASIEVIIVSSHSVQSNQVYYLSVLLRLLRLLFVTAAATVSFAFAAATLVDRRSGCGRDAKLTLLLSLLESSTSFGLLPCALSPPLIAPPNDSAPNCGRAGC